MAVGREARRPGILASFFRLDSHAPRKVKVQRRVSRLAEGPRPLTRAPLYLLRLALHQSTPYLRHHSASRLVRCLSKQQHLASLVVEAARPTVFLAPRPPVRVCTGSLPAWGGAGCVFGAPLQPRRQSATGCSGKRDLDGSGRDWEQAKQRQGLPLVQRRCCQIGVALHSGGRARGGTRTPAGARACLPVREPLTRCRFLVPQVVILPRARSAHALLVRYYIARIFCSSWATSRRPSTPPTVENYGTYL